MTVCKYCGATYDKKDSFCPECGTKNRRWPKFN